MYLQNSTCISINISPICNYTYIYFVLLLYFITTKFHWNTIQTCELPLLLVCQDLFQSEIVCWRKISLHVEYAHGKLDISDCAAFLQNCTRPQECEYSRGSSSVHTAAHSTDAEIHVQNYMYRNTCTELHALIKSPRHTERQITGAYTLLYSVHSYYMHYR